LGEDFLAHVGGVGIVQPSAAAEALDERRVRLDELSPRPLIGGIANPQQQAGRRVKLGRRRGFAHLTSIPCSVAALVAKFKVTPDPATDFGEDTGRDVRSRVRADRWQ
jgi:hypothetical protein